MSSIYSLLAMTSLSASIILFYSLIDFKQISRLFKASISLLFCVLLQTEQQQQRLSYALVNGVGSDLQSYLYKSRAAYFPINQLTMNEQQPVYITYFQEKSDDKRELGAKVLQNLVRDVIQQNPARSDEVLRQLIRPLRDYLIQSSQLHCKKNGLYGLLTIGKEISRSETLSKNCLEDLLQPMIDCFKDKDENVRQAGIEYVFYMCKDLNDVVLLKLDDICRSLQERIINLDSDQNVKIAAKHLDKHLKSLVLSTPPEKQYFRIKSFITMIGQRLTFSNPEVKDNLISWIDTLNQIPHMELLDYVQHFLYQLFMILAESPKRQDINISARAKRQLDEFLKDIERYSHRHIYNHQHELQTHRQIIDILIQVSKGSQDSKVQEAVLSWFQEYLRIILQELDQNSSQPQQNALELSGGQIIKGVNILQNTIFDDKKESVLLQVIMENLNSILKQVLTLLSYENRIANQAQSVNEQLLQIMDKLKESHNEQVDIMPTISEMLNEQNSSTSEKALIWMRHLLQTQAEKLKPQIESILERLIDKLKDSDTMVVVQSVMDALASVTNEQYFDMVIEKILGIFYKNQNMLQKMSDLIIIKLCCIWNAELVYTTICTNLLQHYVYVEEESVDLDFASQLVQSLEYLLITDPNLLNVRQRLRNYKYEKNEKVASKTHEFFMKLYRTFCFNSVSGLTLSLLAEEYELSYKIILILAETEANLETLVQIAKLILLLESPVFAYLRLQLLEASRYPYLLQSLEGLMMMLPQTPIQNQLKQRLKNVDIFFGQEQLAQRKEIINKLDTTMLLKIFNDIRKQEKKMRKQSDESD